MPGPKDSKFALQWVQDAVRSGRYHPGVHFYDMLYERHIDMDDAFNVIEQATFCEPYDRPPVHGGTSWRFKGRDVKDTKDVWVGCEAYLDAKKHRCILCTIFDPNADKKR